MRGASLYMPPPHNSFLSSSSSDDGGNTHNDRLHAPHTTAAARAPRRRAPRTITGELGTYLLGEKIGSGAFSIVRAAINVHTLRVVAVKIMDLRKLRKTRQGVQRANAEIRMLRALHGHLNVAQLYDVVRDEARMRLYLVLEMCNGGALQDLIQKEGTGLPGAGRRLPPTQVANIVFQVLTALEYVHGRGYVHRDVKPANLMLTAAGDVKLSDFGVAESLDRYAADDSVSKTLGSPAFQAPEIANGSDNYPGTKVDVWALGVSVFYLLTGDVPFKADTHLGLFDAITKGIYAFPPDLVLNADCRDCLDKMLQVDFNERWTVAQLLHHPWTVFGSLRRSADQKNAENWVVPPVRNFNVLEMANRYMEANGSPPNSPFVPPAPAPQPPPSSQPKRSSLRNMFAPEPDSPPAPTRGTVPLQPPPDVTLSAPFGGAPRLAQSAQPTARTDFPFGADSSDDELTAALQNAEVTRWSSSGVPPPSPPQPTLVSAEAPQIIPAAAAPVVQKTTMPPEATLPLDSIRSGFGLHAMRPSDYELAREIAGQEVTHWPRGVSPSIVRIPDPAPVTADDVSALPPPLRPMGIQQQPLQRSADIGDFEADEDSDEDLANILQNQSAVRWDAFDGPSTAVDEPLPGTIAGEEFERLGVEPQPPQLSVDATTGPTRAPTRAAPNLDASSSGEIRRPTGQPGRSALELHFSALPGMHYSTSATTDVASPVFPTRPRSSEAALLRGAAAATVCNLERGALDGDGAAGVADRPHAAPASVTGAERASQMCVIC